MALKTIPKKVSVFDYTDYRKYLNDFYQVQKAHSKAFSYRYFAAKAKINSVGLYKDVVDGRQSLGRSLIAKFSKAMKHGNREAEYFENMVYFNEARTVEERKIYFERMMTSYNSKAYKVDAVQYEYYAKWYYSAIRALLSYIDFKDDYEGLARLLNPAIRPNQAKKAIRVLEKLGLIKRNKKGIYKLVDSVITTGVVSQEPTLATLNIINFQKAMIDMAHKGYNIHPKGSIDMSTLTLSISKQTYRAMKKEIAAFRQKLARMASHDKDPDRVYELNYQLFPLTIIKGDNP